MKKKKELLLLIAGLMSIVLITVGVTFAFFNYTREGSKENSITTGSITFIYTENADVGNGISIEEAYPMSDDDGKVLTGNGQVFDFKVTSSTGSFSVGYEVTARMESSSTLADDAVKLYLTKVTGLAEEELLLSKYSGLNKTTKVDSTKFNEKTLYLGEIPANQNGYEDTFRLRMWLSDDIDFSSGNYNGKTFTLRVNVYAGSIENTNANFYTPYNIGDAVTLSDGSKWHVLENSSETEETITLLSDYNLNTDGSYNTACQGISGDVSSYKCSTMSFDLDNTNIYDETDSNNIGYFIKNTYEPLVVATLPGTTNVTLPTPTQIAKADGQIFNDTDMILTASWLLTTNYWTKLESSNSSDVWNVFGSSAKIGDFRAEVNGGYGARPVITTLKSNALKSRLNMCVTSKLTALQIDNLNQIFNQRLNSANTTRAKTVASAKFLAEEFPYQIPYYLNNGLQGGIDQTAGRYFHNGLFLADDNNGGGWGCLREFTKDSTSTSESLGFIQGNSYNNGLDCSGFVTWATKNGGVSEEFIRGNFGSGNFKIYGENYGSIVEIANNFNSIKAKLRPGDVMYKDGHVGIVTDITNNTITISESNGNSTRGGVQSNTYPYTISGLSSPSFTHVIYLCDAYGDC